MLRLHMIIQFVLPSKPPHTLTGAVTDRAAVFLGAILVLLRVASEVGGVLDGDVAAWVKAMISLASKGRGGMTGYCRDVARWGRGAERQAGRGEGWRVIVEPSEVVNMWSAG